MFLIVLNNSEKEWFKKKLFNFNKFVKAIETLNEYQDWGDCFLIVLSLVDFHYG